MNQTRKSEVEEMKKQVKQLKNTVKLYETKPKPHDCENKYLQTLKGTDHPVDRIFGKEPYHTIGPTENDHPNRLDKKQLEKLGNYSLLTKQELISSVNQYKNLVTQIQKKSMTTIEELTREFKKEKEAVITKLNLKKSKIKKLNREIEELGSLKVVCEEQGQEIRELKETNSLLAGDVSKLNMIIEEKNRLNKDNSTLRKKIVNLEREIENGKKKVRLREKEINRKDNVNEIEKEKQKELERQIDTLKKELSRLGEENKVKLTMQLNVVKGLKKENKRLQTRITEEEDEKNKIKEEMMNQTSQYKNNAINSTEVEIKLAQTQIENKFGLEKINAQRAEIEQLNTEIKGLKEVIDTRDNEIKLIRDEIKEKDSLLEFKTNLIEHTQNKNRAYEKTIEEFRVKEKEYLNEYEGFIKKHDQLDKKHKKLKEEFQQIEEDNAILKSRSLKQGTHHNMNNNFNPNHIHYEQPEWGKVKKVKQLEEINSLIVQFRRNKLP